MSRTYSQTASKKKKKRKRKCVAMELESTVYMRKPQNASSEEILN